MATSPGPPMDWGPMNTPALRSASAAQADALLRGRGRGRWNSTIATGCTRWRSRPRRRGWGCISCSPIPRCGCAARFSRAGWRWRRATVQMVLWEGETDHARDPGRRRSHQPVRWRGGPVRRVPSVEGEWALWASGWPQIELMQTGGGATLADRGDVAQIVAGLGDAVRRYGAAGFGADLHRPHRRGARGLERSGRASASSSPMWLNRREEAALIGVSLRARHRHRRRSPPG